MNPDQSITFSDVVGGARLERIAYMAVESAISEAEDRRGEAFDDKTWDRLFDEGVDGVLSVLTRLTVPATAGKEEQR